MSRIAREKIMQKIKLLGEYITYLKKLARETSGREEEFISDFHFFGLAERYLQLAIQALMDAVKIVIIETGGEKPEDNQEAISILYNQKIISEELAARLDGIVGFRNILVHEYGKINRRLVFRYLQKNVKDLEDFRKNIIKFLSK